MRRWVGVACIGVCVVTIVWFVIGAAWTIAPSGDAYRFNISAPEGTAMAVRNGELDLQGGGPLSIETPFARHFTTAVWGLCFLGCLGGGIALLRSKGKTV